MTSFRHEALRIDKVSPRDLRPTTYMSLRNLAEMALGGSLEPGSSLRLEDLIEEHGWFQLTRLDPRQGGTRGSFRKNQEYSDLTIALATYEGSTVGFAYAADNVSGGSRVERTVKMHTGLVLNKRHRWLREAFVVPGLQRHGIGSALVASLVEGHRPNQPVSAYTWPAHAVGEAFAEHCGLNAQPFDPDIQLTPWRGTVAGVEAALATGPVGPST